MKNTKLIILRGPCGAGKSSVTKCLVEQSRHKTAVIDQDQYRSMFKPYGDSDDPRIEMILDNTFTALKRGYNVIMEGGFRMGVYQEMFDEIFAKHPDENYMFYLDVSFEETLRRHATRPKANEYGRAEMQKWYTPWRKSPYPFEQTIPEKYTLEETIKIIKQCTGI